MRSYHYEFVKDKALSSKIIRFAKGLLLYTTMIM
jgi:hypothetical protein